MLPLSLPVRGALPLPRARLAGKVEGQISPANLDQTTRSSILSPAGRGRGQGEEADAPVRGAARLTLPPEGRKGASFESKSRRQAHLCLSSVAAWQPTSILRTAAPRGGRGRSLLTRLLLFCTFAITSMAAAQAACTGVIAGGPRLLAAAEAEEAVSITFLGHASFLIESPGGVRIVTDYNDAIRAPVTPDIVTMNNAHPTHYSDSVEPGVKYVLRGWDPAGGITSHRLEYRDVRIHNVATNVRESGG